MANWLEFQRGMQDFGTQLGDYARQEQAKKDYLQSIFAKARIEQLVKQSDPYQQAMARLLQNYLPSESPESIDTTAANESGNVVGINKNRYFLKPTFSPQGASFTFEETPEFKMEQKGREQKQTAEIKSQITPQKQQEDLQQAELAYQNLKYMKQKALNLPSGYKALGINFANFRTRGEANPQLALYEKQMPALAVAIYRDVTGDKRLSDKDAAERAYPLLWNPARGEGESIKIGTFEDLDKLYQARIRLIRKGKYTPNPLNSEELITPLEDVLAEAKIHKSGDNIKSGKTSSGISYTIEE